MDRYVHIPMSKSVKGGNWFIIVGTRDPPWVVFNDVTTQIEAKNENNVILSIIDEEMEPAADDGRWIKI